MAARAAVAASIVAAMLIAAAAGEELRDVKQAADAVRMRDVAVLVSVV